MTPRRPSGGISRRVLLRSAAALPVALGLALPIARPAQAQADPLPSWNEGAAKQAILAFVDRVTRQGG